MRAVLKYAAIKYSFRVRPPLSPRFSTVLILNVTIPNIKHTFSMNMNTVLKGALKWVPTLKKHVIW